MSYKKLIIFLVLTIIIIIGTTANANHVIFSQRFTADPAPLVYNGRVYIYNSHDIDGQIGWPMVDYTCISSDDMVNWVDHGEVFNVNSTSWATVAWAPQVIERNGNFYMYFPNGSNGGIGVAVSNSPTGPFTDALGHPLTTMGTDPSVFIDDDSQAYLIIAGGPYIAKLNSNMTSLQTSFQLISNISNFFEAPWLSKINGKYVLSYMTQSNVGHYGYDIAYAISDSPMSGYTSMGSILWNPPYNNSDNVHQGMFQYNNKWYLAYHNRKVMIDRNINNNFQRSVALDRMYVNANGTIKPITSTEDGLQQLKYVNPYIRQEAEMIAKEYLIETEPCSEGARNVAWIDNGDWIKVAGVDFGTGATGFSARVASPHSGGKIELRLGSPTGTLVGTCNVPTTGGWQTWTTATCSVSGASGIQDLYFRFTGTVQGGMFNFNWWQFSGGNASGITPTKPAPKIVALRSKANNKYVSADNSGNNPLIANKTSVGTTEKFWLVDNEDGTYSLQAMINQKYVCAESAGNDYLIANRTSIGLWEKFILLGSTDGSYALQAIVNNKYVAVNNFDATPLIANCNDVRTHPNDGGRFWISEVGTSSDEQQRQQETETAVSAYEAAPITTLQEIATAELLELEANAKVSLVQDTNAKIAFEARIATKKALVEAAKASMSYGLEKSWEFTANVEGWTAANHISGFGWQTGGYIGGTITDSDPYMLSQDNLGVSITDAKTIKIRLKNSTASTTAQIYFTTNTNPNFTESKSKSFTIIANDSKYTEYTIDMSSLGTWTGTLKRLRIDPSTTVTSGSFSIDHVRIYKNPPTINWEYTSDIEGWSVGQQVTGFAWQTGGYIGGSISGTDPRIRSLDNLGVTIGNAKYIIIRMKNSSSSTTGKVYFTTNANTSFSDSKSKTFTLVANDPNYTVYTIDLSDNALWTGTLKRIRVHPGTGVTNGSFSIDYIRIVE